MKRKNGEGSYGVKTIKGVTYKYYRAPNEAWTVYAKTAKELEQKRKAREKKEDEKAASPMLITVSELCEKWLQDSRKKLSPATYDTYEIIYNTKIRDYFEYRIGTKPAYALTVEMLEKYLNSLSDQYSKGTIDKTWTVLRQSLMYGKKNNLVPETLRLEDINKPKEKNVAVKKKLIQFTTLRDIEILYNEANRLTSRGTPVYGNSAKILVFIMYSGLRIGEALGLKWQYVSNDFSQIRVVQSNGRIIARDGEGNAVVENGHKKYNRLQKSTKTESGERTVPIPDRGIEVLRYFDEKFPTHKPNENVFLSGNGRVYDKRNIERTLQRMLENSECENKNYTPHSLRHGYGSILLSKGVDIKTVSVLLGHKDITTTYNIYIHVLEDDKIKAVTDVFNKRKPEKKEEAT